MGLSDRQRFLSGLKDDEADCFAKLYDRCLRSEKFGGAMFGDFMSMEELSRFEERKRYLPAAEPTLFGGFDGAERRMAGFNAEEGDFPIVCVSLTVKAPELTHRDYLGSLMGLGIERRKIGDILVRENGALVMAHRDIGDYIANTLSSVGRAAVASAWAGPPAGIDFGARKFASVSGTVASMRLDSITALLSGKGRNAAAELIKAGRAFVNGINILKTDVKINDGDVITLRGFGKAIVQTGGRSKKDRIFVTLKKYS